MSDAQSPAVLRAGRARPADDPARPIPRRTPPVRRGPEAVASALWLGHERRGRHDPSVSAAPRPTLGGSAPELALDADDADRALQALGRTVAQLDRTRRSLELFVAAITRIPAEDRPPTRLPTVQDARDLEARAFADVTAARIRTGPGEGPEPREARTATPRAEAAPSYEPVPGGPGAVEPGAVASRRAAAGTERNAAPAALVAHLIGRPGRSGTAPVAQRPAA